MPENNTILIVKVNKQWENFSWRDSWERYKKIGCRVAMKGKKTTYCSCHHQGEFTSTNTFIKLPHLPDHRTKIRGFSNGPIYSFWCFSKDWRKGKHTTAPLPRHAMQPPSLWQPKSDKVKVKLLSRVQLFAIPWTVAPQAPQSMGFSRHEYWSGFWYHQARYHQ